MQTVLNALVLQVKPVLEGDIHLHTNHLFQRLQGTCRVPCLHDDDALRWSTTHQHLTSLGWASCRNRHRCGCASVPLARRRPQPILVTPVRLMGQREHFSSRHRGTSHHTRGQGPCCLQTALKISVQCSTAYPVLLLEGFRRDQGMWRARITGAVQQRLLADGTLDCLAAAQGCTSSSGIYGRNPKHPG